MSLRPMFPPSLGLLQLPDRNLSLAVGGFMVKRVAFFVVLVDTRMVYRLRYSSVVMADLVP